jgi:very-short-patch-repair endonuclease
VIEGTDGVWVTDPVQTVVDCCVALPLIEAVVICDSALRAGSLTLADLRHAARRQPGVRAAGKVRRVLSLADPEAGSVLESVLRCRLMLSGLTGFQTQLVLKGRSGQHVRRVDFCFRSARLVVEVDGAKWHQDPVRDRQIDNALACLGFRVLRYAWADVVHDHDRVIAEIRAALTPGTENFHLVTDGAQRAA